MLTGYLPFEAESKLLLYKKILNCEYHIPDSLSFQVVDLLKRILVRNGRNRLGFKAVQKHKWFQLDAQGIEKKGKPFKRLKNWKRMELIMITTLKTSSKFMKVKRMVEEGYRNKYTTM